MHPVLHTKDPRCFNCSGKGHSRRECAVGNRSESPESQNESEEERDAGASESIEGGLDEAETAAQIIPEDAQAVQEVNHLLKSIAGPMLKSTGKRVECGQCEAETVKVSLKKSINPGPERAAQAVQEVNRPLKSIAGLVLKSVGHGISKLKEQVSWMEVLRTPFDRELATRSRTQCRSRLNWLTEPRLCQNPMNGLVLSDTTVESIVPPRGLVELGYAITWSRAGCVAKHPRVGKIECWL